MPLSERTDFIYHIYLPSLLDERCYVTFVLWHEPSVCRLSVMLHLRRDLNFLAIFLHRLIAHGL